MLSWGGFQGSIDRPKISVLFVMSGGGIMASWSAQKAHDFGTRLSSPAKGEVGPWSRPPSRLLMDQTGSNLHKPPICKRCRIPNERARRIEVPKWVPKTSIHIHSAPWDEASHPVIKSLQQANRPSKASDLQRFNASDLAWLSWWR